MPWGDERMDKLNEFIADYPLYRRFDLGKLYDNSAVTFPSQVLQPLKVFRWCPNSGCRTERPFDRVEGPAGTEPTFHKEPGLGDAGNPQYPQGVYSLLFTCAGCGSEFRCWIEVGPEWYEGNRWVRKVGQVPAYDISLPPDLLDALGDDAALYRRALICRSQSFGVGACTYLRRTLENQIQPLLEVVLESRAQAGASEDELQTVRDAMNGRTAEDKIRLANAVLPGSVQVGGENPIELIYDRLSDGLHRRDEQECMSVAHEASEILEYVFTNLSIERKQRQARRAYVERVNTLRKNTLVADAT